jgi:alanine dehydrogenase
LKIGLPKEVKVAENRVALLPDACHELKMLGHDIFVQRDAGLASGYSDEEYQQVGCTILDTIADVYDHAELIVKVKEPQAEEFPLFRSHHILFCYLHLAASPALADALLQAKLTAIAFEDVTDEQGNLPLLRPMSIIAGKLAAQYASIYLHKNNRGRGILIDGMEGVAGANVTVLGYGIAGGAAAKQLALLGAGVTVIDKSEQKLVAAKQLPGQVCTLSSTAANIEKAVVHADVLIGAVLVPGTRAPVIVSRDLVARMPAGAVIVDIAVDQGGCIETTRPTSYEQPTYIEENVLHFAVPNIPAAVPRTASQALSLTIIPAVKKIAATSWRDDQYILDGLCIDKGKFM